MSGLPFRATLVPVLGLEQIGPRPRHVRDDRAVDAERDDAPVVADPEAAPVLHRAWHGSEVAVEVLRVEALVGAVDRERRADVEDVRSARVALERANRLVLLGRRAVRVVVRQLEAVPLLEGRHDLAVVRPVGRQRDRVDLAFLLRLLEDRGEAGDAPPRSGGVGGPRRRTRSPRPEDRSARRLRRRIGAASSSGSSVSSATRRRQRRRSDPVGSSSWSARSRMSSTSQCCPMVPPGRNVNGKPRTVRRRFKGRL